MRRFGVIQRYDTLERSVPLHTVTRALEDIRETNRVTSEHDGQQVQPEKTASDGIIKIGRQQGRLASR